MSRGAGIHPIKATRKTKPAPEGKTWLRLKISSEFIDATPVDNIVLIAFYDDAT